MPKVTSNSSRRLALAKQLRSKVDSFDLKLVIEYIELLQAERFGSLIKSTDETEMSLLVGELRAYEKLLDSLSRKEQSQDRIA